MHKIILFLVLLLPSVTAWSSDKEVDCLAKNIYYEAGAESTEGKMAVGQVTLNRVEHPEFPKTVCGVVHQKTTYKGQKVCQFEWVCKPKKLIKDSRNWRDSREIAENMLTNNLSYDKVYDVYFFHAAWIQIPPGWRNNHRVVTQIGQHVFYKRRRY